MKKEATCPLHDLPYTKVCCDPLCNHAFLCTHCYPSHVGHSTVFIPVQAESCLRNLPTLRLGCSERLLGCQNSLKQISGLMLEISKEESQDVKLVLDLRKEFEVWLRQGVAAASSARQKLRELLSRTELKMRGEILRLEAFYRSLDCEQALADCMNHNDSAGMYRLIERLSQGYPAISCPVLPPLEGIRSDTSKLLARFRLMVGREAERVLAACAHILHDVKSQCRDMCHGMIHDVSEEVRSAGEGLHRVVSRRWRIEFNPKMVNPKLAELFDSNTLIRRKTDDTCSAICRPRMRRDRRRVYVWGVVIENSCTDGGFGICTLSPENVECCRGPAFGRISKQTGIGVVRNSDSPRKMAGSGKVKISIGVMYVCVLNYEAGKFYICGPDTFAEATVGDGPYCAYVEPCCKKSVYRLINL